MKLHVSIEIAVPILLVPSCLRLKWGEGFVQLNKANLHIQSLITFRCAYRNQLAFFLVPSPFHHRQVCFRTSLLLLPYPLPRSSRYWLPSFVPASWKSNPSQPLVKVSGLAAFFFSFPLVAYFRVPGMCGTLKSVSGASEMSETPLSRTAPVMAHKT